MADEDISLARFCSTLSLAGQHSTYLAEHFSNESKRLAVEELGWNAKGDLQ